MFVRTLKSRDFLVTAAVILACGGFFYYQLYKSQTELALLRSPEDQISLTQDKLDEVSFDSGGIVAITDFEFMGEPFAKEGRSYQLLSVKNSGADESQVPSAIAYSNNLHGDALREIITASKGGNWWPVKDSDSESSSKDSDEDALVHPDYPDLDLSDLSWIGYRDLERFSTLVPLFWAIVGGHILYLGFAFYFVMRYLKKREAWQVKLDNFDPKILDQYSHALRLCGAENPGLPSRKIDPNFDVAPKPKSNRPKLKRWSWKLGALLVISTIGFGLQLGTNYGLGDLIQNGYVQAGVGFLFMMGIQLAIFKAQGVKVGGTLEEPIKPGSRWAKYQTLPFFKYHDHVLKSLGMIELGAFKQTGGHVCMVRTIYLSPNGNVLVEVGIEGREFFTIESVINSGKFLETHSMASPSSVKADLLQRHQRRSASHEDILQALEDHDHFVSEFAGSGFSEAEFNAEKFPRFLDWGGEKNAT